MSSIDNRIVKMTMENSQFQSAASSTMTTLKKLNDSLKLTEGAKGLDDIAKKAKDVDMDTLASSVEEVKKRFSVLDIVGVTALVNIANSAVEAGKRVIKSLTIDPIKMGFQEYELKINSVQTIMASTGEKIDVVNGYLEELNEYADKTIYSFSDMTENIGKFTNAGVKLEDAVMAIKGISNEAAISGANANEASRAMYNFAQAIAAGHVKLIDWKSIELANMATKEFKQQLIDTAVAMGTVVKVGDEYRSTTTDASGKVSELFNSTKGFNESLSAQWMTTEVLIGTLKKYADETTDIGKRAFAAAQDVKTFSQMMDTLKESAQSGWAQTWEIIFGNLEEGKKLWTSVSEVIGGVIEKSAEYRNNNLKIWKDAGGREAIIKGLTNVFEALGKVLGPIYDSFRKIFDPWNGNRLADLSKGFENMTSKLKVTDKVAGMVSNTFDGIFSAFAIAGKVVGGVVGVLANFIPLLSPIAKGLLSITSAIGSYISGVNDMLGSTNIFKGMLDVVKGIVSSMASLIGGGLEAVANGIDSIKNIDISGLKVIGQKVADCFSPIEAVGVVIKGVIDGIKSALGKFISVAAEFASKVWGIMSSISQAIIDTLGGKGNAMTNIMSTGLLAGVVLIIKKILDFFANIRVNGGIIGNVVGIIDSITEIFDGVKDSIKSFQNGIKAGTLQKIAIAIGILAGSLLLISTIDSKKLATSLAAMGGMFTELVASMAVLDKIGGAAKVGVGIIILSTAVLILASAMKKIETISWEDTAKGLLAIGAMLAMLIGVSKTMETSSKGMIKSAAALVIFSAAINVLTSAVKSIGELDVQTITKGLMGIAGILLEISIFMKLIGNPKGMISTSISMVILGGALLVLTSAIEKMANLNTEVMGKGLLKMASSLVIIAGAMRLMPKGMFGVSTSLVKISGALLVLSNVLSNIGEMSWEQIGKGLVALAGSLTILAVSMNAMEKGLPGATAMVVMAGAIAILTPALMGLGSMSLESIGKSLLMLAGTFTVLGVAGLVLAPIVPTLLSLGGAVGLLGVACMAVGVGISAFAAGLGVLAASGTAGAAALVVVVTSIIRLVPMIAVALAEGIVSIIKVFLDNTAVLASALTNMLITAVQALTAAIPAILELIGSIITGILNLLIEVTPTLVEAIVTVIMSILEALTANIPIIAGYVVESLLTLISTVLEEMAAGIPKITSGIVDIIVAIITSIGNGIPRIVDAIFNMVIAMIDGLANSVETNMPRVRAAIWRLTKAIIGELKSCIKDALGVGKDIVRGLADGMYRGISWVVDAAKDVASRALNAAKNLLGIHSPSREFAKLGMYSDQGLAGGFTKYSGLVEDAAEGVAGNALYGMKNALDAVNDLFNTDIDSQPTIRPVLDLTEIQNGAGQVNSILGGMHAIRVSADAARITSLGFSGINKESNNNPGGSTITNNTAKITNHFNITGNNPEEIAEEVSRIIQTQIERRDVVWE